MAIINGVGRFGVRSYVSPTTSLSSIVTDGLIFNLDASNAASYPGTGTTWTDLSGGKNGTLMNGAAYSSANGGTMVLDGVNDYVSFNLGTYKTLFGTSTSFSTWVKYTNVSGGYTAIFGDWNSSGGNETARFALNGYGNVPGKIAGYIMYGGGGGDSSTTTILPNVWYQYSMTYDGTTQKMYVNGVLEAQSTHGITSDGSGNFAIGRGGDYSGLYAPINISNFQVYNKALSSTEVAQNFNATKARFGFASYTTRTAAFATATGITDATILNALNTFDTGLISNGLDTKMKALYPFVGGTATTHKYNFMDARDVDAAFRLQFNGGWVHNSNGITANGINGYANTFLNANALAMPINSFHASYYARTSVNTPNSPIWIGDYRNWKTFLQQYTPTNIEASAASAGYMATTTTSSNNFTMVNRTSSNYQEIRRTTNILTSSAGIASSFANVNFLLNSSDGANEMSNCNAAMASFGTGMTNSEATTFYNLVQALQTSLSRQV